MAVKQRLRREPTDDWQQLALWVKDPAQRVYAVMRPCLYGWLAGTWPFGVVEGIWAVVALRRWAVRRGRWRRDAERVSR